MELLKLFTKNEVTAIGLTQFKEKKLKYAVRKPEQNPRRCFKPDYSNNFFIL